MGFRSNCFVRKPVPPPVSNSQYSTDPYGETVGQHLQQEEAELQCLNWDLQNDLKPFLGKPLTTKVLHVPVRLPL